MVGGSTNATRTHSILDYHDGWKAGWNGGGWGQRGPFEYVFSGGGGSTDVRLQSAGTGSTNWTTGLYTRIIVAGGAGGSDDMNHTAGNSDVGGGNGGGLYAANGYGLSGNCGRGATYGSGYSFAQGQTATGACGGAGGGGYYGGYSSVKSAGGGGGSGFISGYAPCGTVSEYTAKNPLSITGGNNRSSKVGNVYFYLVERD